jgi:hypothetical protein
MEKNKDQEEKALFEARQKAKAAEKKEAEKKEAEKKEIEAPKEPLKSDSIFDAIKHMVN